MSASIASRPTEDPITTTAQHRLAPLAPTSKGGFYHDGRFADLDAVVEHYDKCMNLGLDAGEKNDLIQCLLSRKF